VGVWSNVLETLRNLLATKQRSALALIGIIIGTGSVVAMISIGSMAQRESLKRFQAMGTDLIQIRLRAVMPGQSLGLERIPAIEQGLAAWLHPLAPKAVSADPVDIAGSRTYVDYVGTTAALAQLNDLVIAKGRFISPLDRYRRFCVLGAEIQRRFADAALPSDVGEALVFRGRVLRIIGILEPTSKGLGDSDLNRSIVLPATTFIRMIRGGVSTISARFRPGIDHERATDDIARWLRRNLPDFTANIIRPEQMIAQMRQQMRLFTLMLGVIGSISLIVGGVGVMNIMLVSVTERRREIGVRVAIGARRWDVRMHFLIEAMMLSLFGGVLGIGLGVLTAWLVSMVAGWAFFVSVPVMILGFTVSAAVGIFSGLYPAVQASKTDPIVALRS